MDSLTHGLLPFLAGKFFRRNREECGALLLGGLAPDFDIFIMWISMFFQTSALVTHRGITHTLVFGLVTAAAVLFVASRGYFQALLKYAFRTDVRLSMKPHLLLFTYIGLLSHLFLDGLTTYGIPLFYPFSLERYSLELFFYIDFYLFAISAALILYAISKRRKISLPPEARSKKMQGTYVKMFFVLVAALLLLSGLRYYEKSVSADYFNLSKESVFPSLDPFEWNVVDRAGGTLYVFDSLGKKIAGEQNFSGVNPNTFRRQYNRN